MMIKHNTTYDFLDTITPTTTGTYPITGTFFDFFGADLELVSSATVAGVRVLKTNMMVDSRARVINAIVPTQMQSASLSLVVSVPAVVYLTYMRNAQEFGSVKAVELADGVRDTFLIQPGSDMWGYPALIATIANGTFTSVSKDQFDQAEAFAKVFYVSYAPNGIVLKFKYPPLSITGNEYGSTEAVVNTSSTPPTVVPVPVYVKRTL